MRIYTLNQSQFLNISLQQAWDFFSNPANLPLITPPELSFKINSALPPRVFSGLIVHYTVRPILGIPVTWVSEIKDVIENSSFVDFQICGPYQYWHHLHTFRQVDQGGESKTEMIDLVHYSLFGGIVAAPIHKLIVRPQLDRIFAYRKGALNRIFCK